jgi:putative SOS response-associated peptidase YedK
VIPASGYYEWKATAAGKQPYYISARDGSVLSFAGLCTRKIHDRMPVILDRIEPWLNGKAGVEALKPAAEDLLQMWPVSREVNRVGSDSDPTLINAIQ